MDVDYKDLNGIRWPPGSSARLWFCQPRVELTAQAPFSPTTGAESLDLLRAVLDLDARMGAPADGAPSIILLPELSVSRTDLDAVRGAIRGARANLLLIAGMGHMSGAEIDAIEPSGNLCGEPIVGHYANCALIACSGSDQVFLQPKVVASREELDCHWPGTVVRYFNARNFSFVVLICSEMLDRAQARTTIRAVLDKLGEDNRQLGAIFWLQHNPKPRAIDFSQSLEEVSRLERPTLFVVGTRGSHPPRFENHAVSGAVFRKSTLPAHFNVLTRQFHYAEPVAECEPLSRLVLLRYDVDVNLVDTALASAIQDEDRTPRSQLFSRVVPFVRNGGALADSNENRHLSEILTRSRDRAAATDVARTARIHSITEQLVALGTGRFQEFLDLAILPRPASEALRHAGVQPHPGGDYSCRCWIHRECIDHGSGRVHRFQRPGADLDRRGVPRDRHHVVDADGAHSHDHCHGPSVLRHER